MKSKLIKAFGYIAATSVCTLVFSSSVFAAQMGMVKETINIRKLPVDVGKVVGVLYAGEKVTIVQEKLGWYYISKNGKSLGWVNGTYLNISNSTVSSAPSQVANTISAPSSGNIMVTQAINVRQQPNTNSKVVAALYKGSKAAVIGSQGGWLKIQLGNKTTGYILATYATGNKASSPVEKKVAATASAPAQPKSGIITTTDTINVRQQPNTSSKVLGAIAKGSKTTVIGSQGGWLKIKLDNKTTGYILATYAVGNKTPSSVQNKTVAAAPVQHKSESYGQPKTAQSVIGVNIRKTPNRTAPVINSTYPGVGFYVLGKVDEWYKVKLSNSSMGYILSKYVKFSSIAVSRDGSTTALNTQATAQTTKNPQSSNVATDNVTTASSTASLSSSSDSRIAFAKKFIGTPYVWGGTSPSGFDCSGFIQYVNRNYGISLTRVASSQAAQGDYVDKGNLQPGDLVFFDTSGSNSGNINHVGMYIGGGQFIHASSGRGCVTISDITGGFYASAYVKAKRMR